MVFFGYIFAVRNLSSLKCEHVRTSRTQNKDNMVDLRTNVWCIPLLSEWGSQAKWGMMFKMEGEGNKVNIMLVKGSVHLRKWHQENEMVR